MTTRYHASMTEGNDSLINFIATTVESLSHRLDTISDQMATKVDLANLRGEMATKEELAGVKNELAAVKDQMATKDELAAVKNDLAAVRDQMATKDELGRLETTMRGEFERVHIRLDSMDRRVDTRMGQIETDVSRLRSVVYLLVKDKPDMLRLLGQPTPVEGRPQG